MKRITASGFCPSAWAIAGLVATLTTVIDPALANQVPAGKNQDGAEILDKGGVIEDKYDSKQQPGPNYPADDGMLQQDAEKARGKGFEDMLRRDQDQTITEEYDDQTGILSWPEDYWYWPYPLSPYYY